MTEDDDKVFTIIELAGYLKIPKSTLYKLVRSGSVPCVKVGKQWRFHKDAIDAWLTQQHRSERKEGGNTIAVPNQ
jgi:excisionase family DNA binding protein